MGMHISRAACCLILGSLIATPSAMAESVTLRSGNGTVGSTDSQITMLIGPADTNFTTAFTPADFAAADAGSAAFIINPHGAWLAALPGDSLSEWISTNPNGAGEGASALYAIDFTLTDPIATATLDLHYAVDNTLGGGPNQGVYLNGQPISGSSTGGGFNQEHTISRTDIAPLLQVGTNTLYINSSDLGGPGGLMFRAEITTTIPEPTTLAPLALATLLLRRRNA